MSPEELKRRREALGLTQQQMSETLGVTVSAISKWEATGGDGPSMGKLVDLALQRVESEQALVDP